MLFGSLAKLVQDHRFELQVKDNSLTPIIVYEGEMIDGDNGYVKFKCNTDKVRDIWNDLENNFTIPLLSNVQY